MTKICAGSIERVKIAAEEKSGGHFTDDEVVQAIAAYFDPTLPPPDFTQEQVDGIVEGLLGEESN
jgi:hypothetical protein